MPSVALATDSVTIATVNATGNTVDVPIYIRDTSGTPLGVDQPAGSKIQSFSIKVTYAPTAAVQSIAIARAGITANLNPSFESKPSTSNTISIIDTFSESSDAIPFTLNAGAPGNLVAHLTVTLSSSASPGSSITFTLDSSTTQLSNQGGTTSEKVSNSNLNLTNGAINIPNLTLSLSPTTKNINLGASSSIIATLNIPTGTSTQVSLSSSNPSVAKVPASINIAAGTTNGSFSVQGLALGSATITATLPNSASATATVNVNPAPVVCNKPDAPVLTAPATVDAGVPYTITWAEVANATEYLLDESTDPTFATGTTTQTLTTTSASLTHNTGNTRYYYRLRAHNKAGTCDVTSESSVAVSVLINPIPVPLKRILAVVGSVQGGFGSNFKTSVQLYNPKDVTVSGKIVFHTQGVSGTAADPSLTYSLAPGKTQSIVDLLPAMGIASGLGSADIITDINSPLPVSLVRVYNDAGANGTTGLAEDQLAEDEALQPGQIGVLIAPADVAKFRLNIGVRTLDSGAAMNITVRDKDGLVVKTTTKSFPGTFFIQQPSAQMLDGYTLVGGETISFQVTSGSVFIYGSTTDNTTNDPAVQLAHNAS
jgi:hypothetical protein